MTVDSMDTLGAARTGTASQTSLMDGRKKVVWRTRRGPDFTCADRRAQTKGFWIARLKRRAATANTSQDVAECPPHALVRAIQGRRVVGRGDESVCPIALAPREDVTVARRSECHADAERPLRAIECDANRAALDPQMASPINGGIAENGGLRESMGGGNLEHGKRYGGYAIWRPRVQKAEHPPVATRRPSLCGHDESDDRLIGREEFEDRTSLSRVVRARTVGLRA